jgi:hypothetical protein
MAPDAFPQMAAAHVYMRGVIGGGSLGGGGGVNAALDE